MLEKVSFSREELDEYMSAVGRDLFTHGLRETLQQFSEADNFGSLSCPGSPTWRMCCHAGSQGHGGQPVLADTHQRVLRVLRMADYLSPRYAVVVGQSALHGRQG